jgi:hypothetical protein
VTSIVAPVPRLVAGLLALALSLPAAVAAAAPPRPPHQLPGDAVAAGARAGTWIVGARAGAESARIARRHGGRAIAPATYVVARAQARPLAGELRARGLLRFSEADVVRHRAQNPEPTPAPPRAVPDDPLSPLARWRDAVAAPDLPPPPVTAGSPRLALIDSLLDKTHEEFAASSTITIAPGGAMINLHGTATAGVAAAPLNGVGFTGIWPGMRALNIPLPEQIGCSDSARGISRAVRAKVAVINMSYGSATPCYSEYVAVQYANAAQIAVVAAAGNEFADGNPLEFPASLPHVITVAAVDDSGRAAYFSNANAAIDLSAPGVGILTSVPKALDTDGNQDGYMQLDGTSFAAPMVAAATTWVRAARPSLTVDQLAQVVRISARDIDRKGWDPATGFGLLDLRAALAQKAPLPDPMEPNEDIEWVDGRAFGRPDRPVWTGGKATTVNAILDAFEDPVDVYRIRVPAGARAKALVRPRFGDPDLRVLRAGARDVRDRRRLVGSSTKSGTRTESVTFRNVTRAAAIFYVVVNVEAAGRSLDSVYRLKVSRLR